LYFVLTVIPVDLAVGLLRLTGLASRDTVRSRRFRTWRLAVSLGVPLLVVAFGAVNHRVLRAKEYRIEIPRRSSSARELTIVYMSDLHFRDLTSDRFLNELSAKVNAQKPDLILLGGDLLEGDRRGEDTGRYERAFRRMISKYGIYGVPGNHEGFSRAGTSGFLERAGIRFLQDEVAPIDDAMTLVGRKDARSRNRKSVAELMSAAPRDLPVILLAHRPTGFDEARAAGVDIQLSGHTHHGQLFPVNLITRRQYDLSWGHLEKGGAHLFVTSGVQGWGPPVRTVGASEILVIHIAFRGGDPTPEGQPPAGTVPSGVS
jgi:predicted MPP superfamily phosphohydrolase